MMRPFLVNVSAAAVAGDGEPPVESLAVEVVG